MMKATEVLTKAQVKRVRSLQQKKFREAEGLFVAEGDKCIEELIKGFELVHLYREGENATRVEIEQMSSLRTPQGSIGVFRMPFRGPETENQEPITDLVVALDGVQDPGNMGTIIRTCDWFGVRRLVCSRDTADCFNPKVVQATMGALARVRVEYVDLKEWIDASRRCGIPVIGTLLEGENMYEVIPRLYKGRPEACSLEKASLQDGAERLWKERREPKTKEKIVRPEGDKNREPMILVMGNEGNGLSEGVRKLATHKIRIPSYPKNAETSESLNVAIATAVVIAYLRQ